MMKTRLGRRSVGRVQTKIAVATFASALLLGGLATAAPASAATTDDAALAVLSEFRSNLVASGATADVVAFDNLSVKQRGELASYFLAEGVSVEPSADASVEVDGATTVYTDGDFEWSEVNGATPAQSKGASAAALAVTSRTTWGKQSLSFAGITLTETKVTMTYEYKGSTATKFLSYGCNVALNTQPFTEVSTSKSNGYISGGQATAKCNVVVKRGVPTPWGTLSWSTYSAIQRLSATGSGSITFNGWE